MGTFEVLGLDPGYSGKVVSGRAQEQAGFVENGLFGQNTRFWRYFGSEASESAFLDGQNRSKWPKYPKMAKIDQNTHFWTILGPEGGSRFDVFYIGFLSKMAKSPILANLGHFGKIAILAKTPKSTNLVQNRRFSSFLDIFGKSGKFTRRLKGTREVRPGPGCPKIGYFEVLRLALKVPLNVG